MWPHGNMPPKRRVRGPLGHLKFKGINPKTARLYRKEVQKFFQHLESCNIEIPPDSASLDAILAEYINHLYQEGDSISHAGWLMSGFRRFIPSLKGHLPTASQYYSNWVRDHLPSRAVPMPWSVLKALVATAWRFEHFDLGLCLLLGFVFYLRTMEMITLKLDDIVIDSGRGQVILCLDNTKPSGPFSQSLVVRNPRLTRIIAFGYSKLVGNDRVWPYSIGLFRVCFTRLLRHFDLQGFNFSLYSLRRGGATFSYASTHDLNRVVLQGRWKDVKTARLYLDDARANLVRLAFLPSHHNALGFDSPKPTGPFSDSFANCTQLGLVGVELRLGWLAPTAVVSA